VSAVAVADRLASLCEEFAQPGQTTVDIPLSQAALASRWQVSASTVNKFIRTCEEKGQIVSRKPLRLDPSTIVGRNRRPVLTLVESATQASGAIESTISDRLLSQPPEHWVEAVQEALIQAASNGHLDVVLALEERLFSRRITPMPAPFTGVPARIDSSESTIRASNGAVLSQSREEFEGIPSNSHDRDSNTATEGADSRLAVSNGESSFRAVTHRTLKELRVEPEIIDLVARRIGSSELRAEGTTPAWLRPGYSAPTWDDQLVEQLSKTWSDLTHSELAAHPKLALQLWSPDEARHALEVLADSDQVREPMGQLLEAAVWGYHKYFPIDLDTASSLTVRRAEIQKAREILASTHHYPTPSSVVERMKGQISENNPTRALLFMAAHYLSGVISAQELAEIDGFDLDAADIEAEAQRVAALVEVVR